MPPPLSLPPEHERFLLQAVPRLAQDPRLIGIAAAGSYADDTMDEFSDLDLVVAVEEAAYLQVQEDRQTIAAGLGDLLAAFTGEHVGDPRLLICLYGSPTLHVDLKFIRLADAGARVDEPVVLWERDGRLTHAMAGTTGRYSAPNEQWIEDRWWTWIHYVAAKVGRGELLEAVGSLTFLRERVLSPLGLQRLGLRPSGVRRVEATAPDLAHELRQTVAAPTSAAIVVALRACVAIYRRLRTETGVERREAAERAAEAYLDAMEQRAHIKGDTPI